MDKYTTLVFRNITKEESEVARGAARLESCVAWSMDHEILRLELIEKALDDNNIELAKSYIGEVDVIKHIHLLSGIDPKGE